MKRLIRYLYEYEHGRRLRNVGFVKVEQGGEECTLHIHGKGLHMKGEQKLIVYLFFKAGDECVGIWQGTIDNVNPAINYRLYYTEEDVGGAENFQKIDGIILESEMGHKYAAVWDDKEADIGNMRVLDPAREEAESIQEGLDPEEEIQDRSELMMEEEIQDKSEPMMEEGIQDRSEPMIEEGIQDRSEPTVEEEMQDESESAQEAELEEDSQKADTESQETCRQDVEQMKPGQRSCRCTKIQRNDIARLPRCEWKWANNSFLLHGYYNYHHLALIHDGNRVLLGVPGIYHPQEAKAANVFGFTEFIPRQDMEVDLTEDEGDGRDQFGYWCRPVKKPLKM